MLRTLAPAAVRCSFLASTFANAQDQPKQGSRRQASDRGLPFGGQRTREVQRNVVVGAAQNGQEVHYKRSSQALKTDLAIGCG
jgi:hypothetical protein